MGTASYVVGLLVSATGSALFRKVMFQLTSTGVDGQVHHFVKPWFTTFTSVLACWASLVLFRVASWLQQRSLVSSLRPEADPLLQQETLVRSAQGDGLEAMVEGGKDPNTSSRSSWQAMAPLFWPAACNVLSIILQGEGLRYVTASVSQMISGSCIIFTAVLAVTVLKCRLNWLHLTGIGLSLVGIVAVSAVSVLMPAPQDPAGNSFGAASVHTLFHKYRGTLQGAVTHGGASIEMELGVGLTLLSMFVLALQLILEEIVVGEGQLHPMEVMGYEGILGTCIMVFIGLPLAWVLPGGDVGGRGENTVDSLYMLWNSASLNAVNVLFFLSVVGLNVFGLFVTRTLGSVFRAVLLTARTAIVWFVNVSLFALHVGGGSVGEPWLVPASYLQLAGFAVLLAGTIIYGQGSSVSALLEVNVEDVLEDVAQAEGRGSQGPSPLELSGRPVQAMRRGSLARISSIARPHASVDVRDSIMIPRTHVLVDPFMEPLGPEAGLGTPSSYVPPTPPAPTYTDAGRRNPAGGRAMSRAMSRNRSFVARAAEGDEPGFMETLLAPSSWIQGPLPQLGAEPHLINQARLARQSLGTSASILEEGEDVDVEHPQ